MSNKEIQDPIIQSNIRIFRYMNRHQESQNLVEWKIDLLIHEKKSTVLSYQDDWKKLMEVTDEIEKDEFVANVIVSSKGTEIKFNGTENHLYVKVGEGVDKKQACWKTIIKYLNKLEKTKK